MTVLGVALIASGLAVLLVMWRTLWPTRATAEGWMVSDGWADADAASPAGELPSDGGRRRRGRRRATRTGLFRRPLTANAATTVAAATTVPAATTAMVPQQRVGGVRTSAAPAAAADSPFAVDRPAAAGEFDWFDREAFVPVIGTTVAGKPFRGVASVPDGRHRRL